MAGDEPQDKTLADDAVRILREQCAECHGKTVQKRGLNVLDRELLLDGRRKYVVPGNLEASMLWERVGVFEDMPENGSLSAAEQEILRRWIDAGAPPPSSGNEIPRTPISLGAMIEFVHQDLQGLPLENRRRQRYFSLGHLHNNASVSNRDLRLFRAALSKLINSLCWEREIVLPAEVDPQGVILRIDLDDLGWDELMWQKILALNPYGLVFGRLLEPQLADQAEEIIQWTGEEIIWVRADWFISTASIPPLYHALLGLPQGEGADAALEKRLDVNVTDDFRAGRLARAGFINSGVSLHNRLVDRHRTAFGAYWKSYDFESSVDDQSLLQSPLGPRIDKHPFPKLAFAHNGGEIIFNLPNGLQAYLLVDAAGRRIDEGPINIVIDTNKPLGSPVVTNGLSCMVCHNIGMKRMTDDIRESVVLSGEPAKFLRRLYVDIPVMDDLLEQDIDRFMASLEKCIGPFLQSEEDATVRIEKFDEPIGLVTTNYVRDLNLKDVAAELWTEDLDKLMILFNDEAYARLGLRGLTKGRGIKRQAWDELEGETFSVFQRVAEQMGLGEPKRFLLIE